MLSVVATRRLGAFLLDVAFEGPEDGVTVLFGPSGAGKSATLALVGGADRPERGRIALGQRVLFDGATGRAVPAEHRRIGWVYQDARLFPHLSVAANLRYGLHRARDRRAILFDEVVGMLGIEGLLGRAPRALSGGERQRVSLGRALLSQPDLLLLDEPLAALDRARRDEILPFIQALKARFALPMLYVTHDEDEAQVVADHVVMIDGGRIVAAGPPRAMLDRGSGGTMIMGHIAEQLTATARTRVVADGRDYLVPAVEGRVGDRVTLRVSAEVSAAPVYMDEGVADPA
jgi:molybdate transport system ATP-binding protein